MRTTLWRAFGVVCAVVFYATSLSGRAYELTSPIALPYHELLRKTYALVAFAVLGYALERSRLRRVHGVTAAGIVIALYSGAIEIGQTILKHSNETPAEHGFDVASGLVGGALGAFLVLLLTARRAPARRTEAVALAIAGGLLVWGFIATYARLH